MLKRAFMSRDQKAPSSIGLCMLLFVAAADVLAFFVWLYFAFFHRA
jgi:hypothetical protein